ncbi:hypothetical protein [Parerythrobacter lacustris]|uniref:Uncharacterized protein n=1 Tax=Parerythrobacter lacustris TaxID=2969984 RepID=A0ABT1XPZ0_9SPHN|nr:hypothetical protein [Parerythrobacter lacustris]MCR2833733.1 hypothetical protein [Parerythrobacter lacustris]
MSAVRIGITGCTAALLALSYAVAAQPLEYDYEDVVISTAKIDKILASPAGWGDPPAYFIEQGRAIHCYIEENPQRAAEILTSARERGLDFTSKEAVAFDESDCLKPFLEVARSPKYADDPFDLYGTEIDFATYHSLAARYIGSCMWEADTPFFSQLMADVENPAGLTPFLREGYYTDDFNPAGESCFPDYDKLVNFNYALRYDVVQQLLVRRGLDD